MNRTSLPTRILRLILPISLALAWIDPVAVAQNAAIPNVAATGPALAAQAQGNYTAPPTSLTSQKITTAPVTGNGDMSIMVGGAASALNFYVGKADFWGVERGAIMPVGSLVLSNSALSGGSYSLNQNVGAATITGQFTQGASQLTLTSWLSVSQNSAVIQLNNTGSMPLTFSSTLLDGFSTVGNQGTYGSGTNSTWLAVSPDTANIEIGNHVDVQSAAPFIGSIADLQFFNSALAPAQLNALETGSAAAPLLQWTALGPGVAATVGSGVSLNPGDLHGGSATFTGNSSSEVWVGSMLLPQTAFTMVAWTKPTSAGTENCIAAAQIPVSAANGAGQYPYVRGLKLVLESGTLSATLNYTTITGTSAIPLNQWTQAAVTYDGTTMTLYADGTAVASTTNFPTASSVMGWDKTAIHLGVSGVANNDCAPQGVLIQDIVGATATPGSQGTLNFTVPAGGQVSIVLAAVTNLNTPTYLATAMQQTQQATSASLAALFTEHNQWWNNFWSKSFVQIPDQTIQSNWYASLYLLACCSKSTSPPPGLWGNFVTNRQSEWQGDYTLDYNYEAPFWAAYASNHMELAANYESPLIGQSSRGDAVATDYGYQGIYFYTHLIPAPGWSDDYGTFWGQKSGALFAAVDCVQHWRYTQDPVYAAEVFPYLKGVADFWDNYLVLQGSVYVDLNDSVAERTGNDTNPATTLAFLRMLYPALIQMSQVLNLDVNMQPTWSGILAQLSPLPIVAASSISSLNALGSPYNAAGVNVIRDSSAGTAFPTPEVANYQNHAVTTTSPGMNSTQTIFPGWQYGVESSGTSLQAAYNTVWLAAEWYDFNNCSTFYPAAAIAGYPPSQILSNLDTLLTYYAHPNFMIDMGGGGTENYAVTPATLAAMFIQSHQTNIHVFPNWPATQPASFGNLNACGGFLVSAAITLGTANYVQVTSNEGQMLNLANPWPSSTVNITSSIRSATTLSGSVLNYQTQTGEVVTFIPASQPSLSAPAGLTGTFSAAGGISVHLVWNPVSGASGYDVKRASVSGGPYTTLATVTSGTSYMDASVAAQTTYYYTVSAVAPGAESANSTELPLTAGAPGVVAPGLVASYLFDEGSGTMSGDGTGDGFAAALYGTAWTTGVEGDALTYNGTSSYATIPPLNLNTNTMTITAWVKLSGSQSTFAGLVYCRAGTTICGLQLGTANELRYTWNGITESNTYNWNSGLVPANGQWTFVAVVVTASNAIIYMQPQGGAMQSATNAVANTSAAFDGVTDFGQDPLGGRFFNGSMDDARIYDIALSAAAVGTLSADLNDIAPTVASPAAASPNPASGPNCNLSVLGASANGESTLTYAWAATSTPAGASAPAFSANGTNSAKNTIAVFSAPGAYTLEANITDASGLNTASSVNETVTTAQAVWTGGGGNGNWSNAANWSGGFAAQAGEQLVLSGSSNDNLSSGTAFNSIYLQGGNTTLNGNQITLIQGVNAAIASMGMNNSIGQAIQLGSNITISTTSGSLTLTGSINNSGYQLTLAAAAGSTVSIQGVVSGAGGLTASGSGTEILSGTNTYSGATTISGGTLQLGDGVTRNGAVTGNITDNATLVVANPFAQTYAGIVNGTGSLVKSGSGTLTLSAAQAYEGSTTISGGTLELANIPIPALPAAGSTLWLDATKGLTLSGGNVLSWAEQSGHGNNATGVSGSYAAYTPSGPSGQPALYFDGAAYLTDPLSASNGNETIFAVVQPSVLANVSYTILGSSASGGLQLRLNGDQLQFVDEHIVNISNSTGTVGTNAPSVVIGTTTSGSQSYYVNSTPIGTGTGDYSFSSGLTSVIGRNGSNQSEYLTGYLSALMVYPSVLTSAQIAQTEMYLYAEFIPNSAGFNYGALPGGSALNLSQSGAALDLDGVSFNTQLLTGVAGTSIYLGGASLNAESGSGSSIYAGNIADSGGAGAGAGGGLIKSGAGTLTLSGILTYSGATQVNAGTLCIAGQLITAGPVNVAAGAALNLSGGLVTCGTLQVLTGGALTGTGTVNATVVNNGTVTASGSSQTLSFSGSVVNYGTFILAGGASLQTSGSFVNDGLLDVMTGAQKLPANLVNNGVVLTASALKVRSLSMASGIFTLNIQSYSGHAYQLQKSTNLSTWQNVGAAQAGATGSALVLSDTNAAAAGTFYRVGVGP